MSKKSYWPQWRSFFITFPRPCFLVPFTLAVLALSLFLSSMAASASPTHRTTSLASAPTFSVEVGFHTRYRDGTWIPVHIALANRGADFQGMLTISPPASAGTAVPSSSLYQVPVTLPAGTRKQITTYIPLDSGSPGSTQSITVHLLDSNGNIIRTQIPEVRSLGARDIFIGLLSDQSTGFGPLKAVALPDQSATLITASLDVDHFPDVATVLNNFDLIILDDFTTSTLSRKQMDALQTWVSEGGALIEVGGPQWKHTLGSLPASLVPVAVNGMSTLPANTSLLPVDSPSRGSSFGTLQSPLTVNTATMTSGVAEKAGEVGETVLASGGIPLIVQQQVGQGTICYLGFDPADEPLIGWPGTSALWKDLLFRTVGDRLLAPNSGPPILPSNGGPGLSIKPSPPSIGASMEFLLQSMLPGTLSLPWLLPLLLVSYLVMLGPVRFLLVRYLKRRDWSWRIVLITIVIFSLLPYGLVVHEKGTSIISNSISIIQFNENSPSAHSITYEGVFVPAEGDFQVHIPGNALIEPLTDETLEEGPQGQQSSITTGVNGTVIDLQDMSAWTMRTIVLAQEQQMNGGIISSLNLNHSLLTGSITNTTNYTMSDTYILTSWGIIRLGKLAAGRTVFIHASFEKEKDNPGKTLADQIAWDNGFPIPYTLDTTPQQSIPLQQHMALLSTLSGEMFSSGCGNAICPAWSVPSNEQKTIADPILFPMYGSDPLLVSGAAATLIGWVDQTLDGGNEITVNGSPTRGIHEALIQAPLTVNLSGPFDAPPGTLTGRLIDVQGTNVQTQPGIYLMTTGSMTFEILLPGAANLEAHPLTISLLPYPPDGIYQLEGNGARTIADGRRLQVQLYNWKTNSWNATQLHMYTLTVNNGNYIGPGGRILFQFANQNPSLGTFVIGQPLLNP